ncbi:MAG: acyltransferase [Reinekea sp.]
MRIAILDPLRFFAALSVVFYHYFARFELEAPTLLQPVAKFGYLGVPLFFIISGFVIALSAENRGALHFAYLRFMRLYPVYWIAILFTTIIATLTGHSHIPVMQLAANGTMLNDYLGFADIDGVYWTLKAELKFYACVFLLLATGLFNKYYLWLTIWTAMSVTHLLFKQPLFMGWFITPHYSPFFISGVLFYLIRKNNGNMLTYILLGVNFITALVRASSQIDGFVIAPDMADKVVAAIVISSFFTFFLLVSLQRISIKTSRIWLTLGGITYPLYLIHNVVGISIIEILSKVMNYQLAAAIMIPVITLTSLILHLYLEKPFVAWFKKKTAPLLAVIRKPALT